MFVNPEHLDFDLVLQNFNQYQCLLENETDEETESLSYRRRRFQSLFENFNAQIETFCQRKTNKSFHNKPTLKSFFALYSVFLQRPMKEGWIEASFQNTPALHWRAKTCSAVSFDRMNFFQHGAFDFTFTESLCYDCYCFREPINILFFKDCQITVKSRILHVFPVPQTGSHIINIILASFSWSAL